MADNRERTEAARRGVEEAETGKPEGAGKLERLREKDPATTEAVEQEAADGPANLGVSR
jgi:hypothetical protein